MQWVIVSHWVLNAKNLEEVFHICLIESLLSWIPFRDTQVLPVGREAPTVDISHLLNL